MLASRALQLADLEITTDLRLGMGGYHPFRFPLANVDADTGNTRLIAQTKQLPSRRPQIDTLLLLANRALHADTPIPLADLANALATPARHHHR